MQQFDSRIKPTSEQVKAMEKFTKYDKSKVEEHFDALASTYETVYNLVGYPDPQQCADYVTEFASDLGLGDNCDIVDFACGTGLVGEHLKSAGFKKIFGLDVSENMLEIAKAKNIYTSLR